MRNLLTVLLVIGAFFAGAFWFSRQPSSPPPASLDPVEEAWRALHDRPDDPALWTRLGEMQARAGQLDAAEHAYTTAIRLGHDNGNAYGRLGFILYERGEDGRALAMLLEAQKRGATVPMIDFTVETLRGRDAAAADIPERRAPTAPARDAGVRSPIAERPPVLDASFPPPVEAEPPPPAVAPIEAEPPPPPPPVFDGVCAVPARRVDRGRTFLVDLDVGGTAASLIIDTGASITVVTPEFAEDAGLRIDRSRIIRAITANGRVDFQTAVVGEVFLAERTAQNVRVAICDDCVQSVADGLLGLDLVAAFGMRLDLNDGVVRFADCE